MNCQIKICGVTSVADAVMAAELGAAAVGVNFYPKSPRRTDEATVRDIAAALPAKTSLFMLAVGESWDETLARFERLPGVRSLQIHHAELTPCPRAGVAWIPAFAIKDETSLASMRKFLDHCRSSDRSPAAVLVDAHVAGSFGGTGKSLPWELLEGFDAGVPLILAGGLTPENVAAAVRKVRPYMVDVASGVESSAGRKDREKIARFVEAVREA